MQYDANFLAKQGATNVEYPNKVQCGISLQLLRARIKIWLNEVAISDWMKTNRVNYLKEA